MLLQQKNTASSLEVAIAVGPVKNSSKPSIPAFSAARRTIVFEGLDEFLTGPTAIATSSEDAVAAAKVISGFAKDHEALEIK
jgi:ribosomal protein L10